MRIEEIVSVVPKSKVVADVGCDHGYIAYSVIKKGLADKVVLTDVSKKCLDKAVALLSKEIVLGKATAICCDGLTKVFEPVDTAIIAGMGGEEIIKIIGQSAGRLSVKNLVLQPMKNSEKLRRFLVDGSFSLIRDYTFFDAGKYYDLIFAVKSDEKDVYSDDEFFFGKENLTKKPDAFINRCKKEIEDIKSWMSSPSLNENSLVELEKKLNKYSTVIGEK